MFVKKRDTNINLIINITDYSTFFLQLQTLHKYTMIIFDIIQVEKYKMYEKSEKFKE